MASINNWLGFSLSPQDQQLPPSQSNQSLISDDVEYAPPLAIPTSSFNVYNHHHSNDWSMNGSTSELSMLVGSSSNNQNDVSDEPKLEDFLGGHSFNNNNNNNPNDYIFSNNNNSNSNPIPNSNPSSSNNNNGIGLSMIKTWLRNQPAPPALPQAEIKNGALADSGTSSALVAAAAGSNGNTQGLSLSMSTGTIEAENGKQKSGQLAAQTGAIEAVPRKSIDTFGQRTSIYRGVTR